MLLLISAFRILSCDCAFLLRLSLVEVEFLPKFSQEMMGPIKAARVVLTRLELASVTSHRVPESPTVKGIAITEPEALELSSNFLEGLAGEIGRNGEDAASYWGLSRVDPG